MPDSTPTNGNGNLRKIADSTVALLFARYLMPVLLATIGFLMVRYLDTVETSIKDIKTSMDARAQVTWTAIQSADREARDALADGNQIKQTLSDHIQRENEINSAVQELARDHESRLRVLERTATVPRR